MAKTYSTGWTMEEQHIWRSRKMPVSMIYMRHQHHVKECELMCKLTEINLPPGEGKFLFLALMGELPLKR